MNWLDEFIGQLKAQQHKATVVLIDFRTANKIRKGKGVIKNMLRK